MQSKPAKNKTLICQQELNNKLSDHQALTRSKKRQHAFTIKFIPLFAVLILSGSHATANDYL